MIYRKVDLYEYYKIERKNKEKGILTVYCRSNHEEVNINRKYPGILVCPGGGYWFTSFREAEPIALKFVEHNIQAFVLDYSCFNDGVYPAQFLEGYLARKYIHEHKDEFMIDETKLGIIGFSAGGHFAGLLSNNHKKDDFGSYSKDLPDFRYGAYIYPVNYFSREGAHQDRFLNLTHSDFETIKQLDFDKIVSKDSSIGFIVSSFEDDAVGYKNTMDLARAYSDNNVPFELHIFNRGKHGISLGDENVYKKGDCTLDRKIFGTWIDMLFNFLKVNNITINE